MDIFWILFSFIFYSITLTLTLVHFFPSDPSRSSLAVDGILNYPSSFNLGLPSASATIINIIIIITV